MLLTVLGEYLMFAPRGVWLETMVGALEALGYRTQAARQAISRGVAAGWLAREKRGRRVRVSLCGDTLDLLRSGAERIYSFGSPWEWQDQWLLVVLRVPETRRDVRHLVRSQLVWAGFGSLGKGLWISPHVEREGELEAMVESFTDAEILWFRSELGSIGHPAKIASEAWDLDQVQIAYGGFIDRFRSQRPTTPEEVFRAQTELVHAWRKFPFLDPDLPEKMLPKGWPRSRAHQVFVERHAQWGELAQGYFRSLEELTSTGPGAMP